MKTSKNKLKNFAVTIGLSMASVTGVLAPSVGNALTVSGGDLTVNLDANALASFNGGSNTVGSRYIYVDDFFDASFNDQIVNDTSPRPVNSDAITSTGLQFNINGSSVTPVPGRNHKPTTLDFTNTPSDGTGQIGTSGVVRISSDIAPGLAGAYLLWDDLGMTYDSGWTLFTEDSIFGKINLFDLTSITESITGDALTITGDLTMAPAWSNFLGATAGTNVGTFSLETTVVPLPAAVWMFGAGLLGLAGLKRKNTTASLQV